MYYLLYNPKSSKGNILKKVNKVYKKIIKKNDCYKINLLEIVQKERIFLKQCTPEDTIILFGGDGTLDLFINQITGERIPFRFLYYPCGSGNDFSREFKGKCFEITKEIQNLPRLRVNGKEEYVFINGTGMGIDAVVCRSKSQYKFSEVRKGYFSIALSSLKTFRPYSLDVEIDGECRHYDNVWFFICNHGKYMGGGMKVTPKAVRGDDLIDVCIVHSLSLRKVIMIFPLIYFGWHTLFKRHVEIVRCKKFKAVPHGTNILQRDGEIIDYVGEMEVER